MTESRNETPLHRHDTDSLPWHTDTLGPHLKHMHGLGGVPDDATLPRMLFIHEAQPHAPALRSPHGHTDDGDPAWTAGTLRDHLRTVHGSQPPDDAALAEMIRHHDTLDHVTRFRRPPAGEQDAALREALAPERRYESITLGVPRNSYPGDLALFFASTNGNGTNIINLRPADMPVLRAAVTPEDPALAHIQADATAALGPGARKYVQQAHAAGYGLGVRDMEAIHSTMTEAERVSDWLAGFYESGSTPAPGYLSGKFSGEDQAAISRVRSLIQDVLDEQQAARHG